MAYRVVPLLLVLTLLASIACGDDMTREPPPLVGIHGTVQGSDQVVLERPESFRVMAVWFRADKTIIVGNDVAVSVGFPAAFSLFFHEPPPAEADLLQELDGVIAHMFAAEIAAYEDVNGDHRYDAAVDRLLGVAARVRFLYFAHADELAAVQSALPGAQLGFNLLIARENDCSHPYPGVSCEKGAIVPLETPITLQLSRNPAFE
ncbi:hypothetical protein LZC95_23580 [Pendulispora brunnea]|uniref:Uncharacterized protein n=1 Tax=Pendulispora brunnea TaxID=2905690 RepID=A0ABZ2KM87_9BACT